MKRWILIAIAAFWGAWAQGAAAQSITVFAASSLKTALDEIATAFQAETGNRVAISYAGTAALARQIERGAPADVFISASPDWMDWLADRGGIAPETRVDLLANRLVIIRTGVAAPIPAADLPEALAPHRIAMAFVEAVPAGQYGKAALTSLGLWEQAAPNVVQLDSVRAALALVALGEAEFGVVYATDAQAEPRVTSVFDIPTSSHPPIRYPAAATPFASEAALAFLQTLQSPEAGQIFAANGFERLGP